MFSTPNLKWLKTETQKGVNFFFLPPLLTASVAESKIEK